MALQPDNPQQAQAWIRGTAPDQIIDFYIPRGNQGEMGPRGPIGPSLTVGQVLVTNGPAAPGTVGPQGLTGPKGDPGGWSASTIIGTGTSFDTLVTSGLYFNPIANASMAPGPTGTGGHLEIISAANWVYQRYTLMGDTRGTYLRARNSSNTWTSWRIVDATRVDQTAGRAMYTWDDLNQRDQLVYGDTGWRDITPTSTGLGFTSGTFAVRRVGSLVTLQLRAVVLTQGSGVIHQVWGLNAPPLPGGFRQSTADRNFFGISDNSVTAIQQFTFYANQYLAWSGSLSPSGGSSTIRPSTSLSGSYSWVTDDPWPTTLPGVASGSIPNA